MKEIKELIKNNKTISIPIIGIIYCLFILIWNACCDSQGITNVKLMADNYKIWFGIDIIMSFIYTYLNNIIMLFLMNRSNRYKQILLISIPLSFILMIVAVNSNKMVANVVMIFFYFIYNYLNEKNVINILKTILWLLFISLINYIFYLFIYKTKSIDILSIDNGTIVALINFNYYIFLSFTILIKNKLTKK